VCVCVCVSLHLPIQGLVPLHPLLNVWPSQHVSITAPRPVKLAQSFLIRFLPSQKFTGRGKKNNRFSKIAQEVTGDSILFASSPQTTPLRHRFPFLEMWPPVHPIDTFCSSGGTPFVPVPERSWPSKRCQLTHTKRSENYI